MMKETEPIKRMIYSKKEAQEILGVGNSTFQQLLSSESNPIPHFRIGRRIIIPCERFQQWLNSRSDHEKH